MRQISIDSKIEALACEYSRDLFSKRKRSFQKPLEALAALETNILGQKKLPKNYANYVQMIIRTYKVLNHTKPAKFDKIHTKFFARFDSSADFLRKKIKIENNTLPFYKHITKAMRYGAVRENEFLPYAKKMGISACVYCNANYALSITTNEKKMGKFELDHWKPQSTFPYLCTNFYNLYPVCANCNKYKLNLPAPFSLFEGSTEPFSFIFELDKCSIVKYLLSGESEDLKILFNPQNSEYNKVFKIEPTYRALKDVAEELLWKKAIYNSSYLKALKNSFPTPLGYTGFHRFVFGNFDLLEDIHRRPLSKFTQDLAVQLGLLKRRDL